MLNYLRVTLIQYNSKQASEQQTEEEASSGTKKELFGDLPSVLLQPNGFFKQKADTHACERNNCDKKKYFST